MPTEEEASRIMGILIIQVCATTRTFLWVEIKSMVKDRISIHRKETHRGTNHSPNRRNLNDNVET